MGIVINENHLVTSQNEFKAALHSFKRMECRTYFFFINLKGICDGTGSYCILHIVIAGNTQMNIRDGIIVCVKVECIRSVDEPQIRGEKVSITGNRIIPGL